MHLIYISNVPTGKTPTKKIEIIGEPNRSANIKVTDHTGKDNQNVQVKTGDISQYALPSQAFHADLISALHYRY